METGQVKMDPISIIVLAAGKGTRMKSDKCKVLHPVAGSAMILRVLTSCLSVNPDKVALVVGYQAEEVKKVTANLPIEYAFQAEQLGTGHAVAATRQLFQDFKGSCLILCGDIPLIEPESIESIISSHFDSHADLTIVTAHVENPQGYGRILRKDDLTPMGIVEEKDASDQQRSIKEVNTGVYIVRTRWLFDLLEELDNNNSQGEYYLTDIVASARDKGLNLNTFQIKESSETLGVNTMAELATASRILWDRKRAALMDSGVCLLDPPSSFIDPGVKIGRDTVIHPQVTITGASVIGANCLIEPGVYISDCVIGDNAHLKLSSRLDRSTVGDWTTVGPMAHLRPESQIGKSAKIGNFVEIKKTSFGDGAKASHLSYLGDSEIGEGVNIGCGTITCNYDGRKKHRTIISANCFIGSDVQFVAPVTIGRGSLIAAGSTITKDVPPQSLGVSRSKQKIYPLRESQRPESWNDKDKS
jgi:bifunctional UDP-N-acetylglucosamine pyrophosphorylase/glucosamine-1-phosphate N-acetyltransferase